MAFSDMDVSVTMKGEEWFALLARIKCLLDGKTKLQSFDTLSAKGAKAYNRGMTKLQKQIVAVAKANPDSRA